MSLTEFLLARIAEDEERGRSLVAQWSDVGNACQSCGTDGARVLAECEAKRRIVEESRRWGVPRKIRPEYRGDIFVPEQGDESLIRQYRRISDDKDDDWPWDVSRIWRREDYEAKVLGPQEELVFLRLLALPYADHPDYDPAWRP